MSRTDSIVHIRGVSRFFAGGVTAVDDVSLDIREGEFFALLGPSGCGKTTLLRMLAGLEIPDRGEILIDGRSMAGVEPNRRPVNMVFQSYAVFPHMRVFNNVAYGLTVSGVGKDEIERRVSEVLQLVQLDGFDQRMPDQLSGGQRQRVALARALVKRPRVLLLDEPLSALDAKLRETMQNELVKLQHTVGITFVVVTHDQDEALSMAERVAVMDAGRIRQLDTPRNLYEAPQNRFVADFVGRMNILPAHPTGGGLIRGSSPRKILSVQGLGEISVADTPTNHPPGETPPPAAFVAIRPEKLSIVAEKPPGDGLHSAAAVIDSVSYYGGETVLAVKTNTGAPLTVAIPNSSRNAPALSVGEPVVVCWWAEDMIALAE